MYICILSLKQTRESESVEKMRRIDRLIPYVPRGSADPKAMGHQAGVSPPGLLYE